MSGLTFKTAVIFALASPLSAMAAPNAYIIDIRLLEKDIRKIEKLQPLRSIDRKRTGIVIANPRTTSRKTTDQTVPIPK